jgi:hypothetical protein
MRCANQCLRRSRVSEKHKVLGSVSGKACGACRSLLTPRPTADDLVCREVDNRSDIDPRGE